MEAALDVNDVMARDFLGHWDWARHEGLMNPATATALSVACRRILGVQEDWQSLRFSDLNVEDLVKRFTHSNSKEFKPQSLKDYERRFRRAFKSYEEYLEDPNSWEYPTRRITPRKQQIHQVQDGFDPAQDPAHDPECTGSVVSLQSYAYPFRPDLLARLDIPRDATVAEMDRLIAWARTLAVDYKAPQ